MAAKKRSKKKTGATRTADNKSSGLSWMVMGLLVGLFVAFLVHLDKIPTKGEDGEGVSYQENSYQEKKPSSKQGDSGKRAQPKEHQFDFYTVLPDREVEVIEVNEEIQEKKKASDGQKNSDKITEENTSAKEKPGNYSRALYQLQVGAFKELKKADSMKARLAFMGVESNIQLIQNNGQKIYRVRVGPITDSNKINQIKAQLKSQNINTFVQKL